MQIRTTIPILNRKIVKDKNGKIISDIIRNEITGEEYPTERNINPSRRDSGEDKIEKNEWQEFCRNLNGKTEKEWYNDESK